MIRLNVKPKIREEPKIELVVEEIQVEKLVAPKKVKRKIIKKVKKKK